MKRSRIDGDEQDAFSKWRRLFYWKPGELKRIKRKANKRFRKQAKEDLRREG